MKTRHLAGKLFSSVIAIILACVTGALAQSPATLDLSGQWRFALDPSNQGAAGNWFDQSLADKISLPGVLQSQGFGDDINTKTPWVLSLYDHFWYEREDYKNYTKPGSTKVLPQPRNITPFARYQRYHSPNWSESTSRFSRTPHWESTVGSTTKDRLRPQSRCSARIRSRHLTPGKHRLSIALITATAISARRTQRFGLVGMSWNGIVGRMELKQRARFGSTMHRFSQRRTRPVGGVSPSQVKIKIGNSTNKAGRGTISANGKHFPSLGEQTEAQRKGLGFQTPSPGQFVNFKITGN